MNFPSDPRSAWRETRPLSSSSVEANLKAHPRAPSASVTRASTTGADSGVAETCSFQPWARVPSRGGVTYVHGSPIWTRQPAREPSPCGMPASPPSPCGAPASPPSPGSALPRTARARAARATSASRCRSAPGREPPFMSCMCLVPHCFRSVPVPLAWRAAAHRQRAPAVEDDGRSPFDLVVRDGRCEAGEPGEQGGERDRRLQPGRVRTDAGVGAVPAGGVAPARVRANRWAVSAAPSTSALMWSTPVSARDSARPFPIRGRI